MKILNPTCEQLWAYQVFRTESIGFMLAMGKTMEAGIERRLNDQTIASNLIEAASVFSASADLFSDISKSLSAAATVSPRTSAKLTKAVRNSFIAWNLEMPGLLAVVAETGNPAFTDKNAYIFGKEAWNFMVDSIVVGMNPASAPEVLSMKLLQLLNDEWALVNTEDLRVKFDSQLLAQRYLLSYYQHGQNTGLLNRSLGLSANASIKDVLTKLASDQLGFKTGLMQIPIHWPIDISRDVDLAYTLKLVKKLDSALVQPRVKFCMEAPQHCGMQLLTQEQVEDNVESAKRTLSHRQAIYSSIAFSGDSKWIVSTDGFELRVTTTDSLTDIRILQTVRSQDNTGAGGPFLGTRDGLKLFAAGDGLTLWNTSRWRPLYHVRYPIARSGQFDGSTAIGLSLDERTLYSGSIACVVRSIDPNNGRVIREIQVFDSRAFCGHALSAQAGLVASYELERGGVAVKLTTLPTLMLLTGALTPSARVSAAKFSPDGEMLALGLESGIVELWDVRSRKILHSISFGEGSVVGIAFMPNGRQFVAGSLKDKNLKIFDTASGSLLQTLPHRRNPFSWTITISQNGKWLAVSEGNDVVLWSLEKLGWN
ncbi:MAG: hypothetical protein U0997_09390 [Sulfurimicrobium sp.]|nr:hypothetical protein [Sulfurimicrobium sp.]